MELRQALNRNISNGAEKLSAIVNRLDIAPYLHRKTSELSQGQQQRLMIALGILHEPKLILADEPTANLDDKNCDQVIGLLQSEAKRLESNLLIITHDHRVKSHFSKQNQLMNTFKLAYKNLISKTLDLWLTGLLLVLSIGLNHFCMAGK